MFEFLKRLVSNAEEPTEQIDDGGAASGVVGKYFQLSERIERAKADLRYHVAIAAARQTYPLLRAFVDDWKRDYGTFDISTSHAVHTAGTLMAVMGERVGLGELRAVLLAVPELHDWIPAADEADRDADLVDGIVALVARVPGVRQVELKKQLGTPDGRRLSTLAEWLEKAGRIRRVRAGSTYELFPSAKPHQGGSSARSQRPSLQRTTEASPPVARPRRQAQQPRVIDLSTLAYVRLPMAPPAWAERHDEAGLDASGAHAGAPPKPLFGVDVPTWRVIEQAQLSPTDRPDPAFKEVFHTNKWTYWLDPKGHREAHPDALAVLRVTDDTGRLAAERGLARDVYRADVNTDGSAIVFLSRDGVLHAYDQQIETILEESLVEVPEYAACAARLGIERRELKNHVRCVAISTGADRYLYTVVDEAWCVSRTGEVLWGLRMPTQEGWTRIASSRSQRVGASSDVDEALRLMGLSFPITPDAVAQQYRRLAMRWHPDRNPGDREAVVRMQQLNAAMELLTGADLSNVASAQLEAVTYQKILSTRRITIPGEGGVEIRFSMEMSEKSASDWIYAANFGWRDNRAYLASYSGKVIEVSSAGTPMRVYDIGAVPRHIADAGAHLYLLTDTRLYVLSGERLDGLVDVRERGDFIVAERGFGLLAAKAFTWFSADGTQMGTVSTKDPIRRVLTSKDGLIVETRRHRATIVGPPPWWDATTESHG